MKRVAIELNRSTFRRLVQLYLLSMLLSIVAFVLQYVVWPDFVQASDRLVIEYFGEPTDLQLFSLGGLAFVGFIAHLVAIFGLLRFKSWSKVMIWASLLAFLPLGLVPGFDVTWSGFWSDWIDVLGCGLLGAILLLAYSKDHGAVWFVTETDREIGK